MIPERLIAILLYPGLGLALVLALAYVWLAERQFTLGRPPSAAVLLSFDGVAALASIVLAGLALALLPWPMHPAAGWPLIGNPLALWVALESAFLLPQLPRLLAPAPLAARAATRELQISVAGRCVFWLALGTTLWSGVGWSLVALPGRLLLGLAGLLALPAAIGAGPFAAERSLSAAGAEEGLDEGAASLVRLARHVRGVVLLAALAVAVVPLGANQSAANAAVGVPPWVAALLIAALFCVVALLLRQVALAMPRLTLPAALRWCWWRALPVGLVGLLYLILTRQIAVL